MRDIAAEAVLEVYEFGAGHKRAEFEDDRNEKARRFRQKYGSGDKLQSNAAPHFIGVFDTVASLGAKGVRRWVLGAGLTIMVAVPIGIVAALISYVFGPGFWWSFLVLAAAIGAYSAWIWLSVAVKVIHNSPVDGKTHWHIAQWRSGNYDRLLSGHVGYGRSANAIDETRADFDRVGWGSQHGVRAKVGDEPDPLIQLWFAGNHSDVGGSYAEVESWLSDIALDWMIEQAKSIPNPLLIEEQYLLRHPSADGVQHCEIAGMHDLIESRTWKFLQRFTGFLNWKEKVRHIEHDAKVHQTVHDRFALPSVTQCASFGAYRPRALAGHDDFKAYYPQTTDAPDSAKV